jgi:hypothetical protein
MSERALQDARTVVLVEGESDRTALESLSRRLGRRSGLREVAIVSIGGASHIGRFVERFGPHGENRQLAGLCDLREVGVFGRALHRGGVGTFEEGDDLARLGFFVCVVDRRTSSSGRWGPTR